MAQTFAGKNPGANPQATPPSRHGLTGCPGLEATPRSSRKKDFANEHPSLPSSGLLWYLTGMQGEVLTVEEVAKLLRVSRKTVEKLIYAKKLHAVKVGRVWRIPRAAVEAFLGGKEYREP